MIDKKNHFPNTTFTLCALFTLAPNEPLFKTLDVKKKMYGGITELLMDHQIMSHFSDIFAKKPLRLLAYTILTPLLQKSYKFSLNQPLKNRQHILLKKYLKKYRCTYYRYFYKTGQKTSTPPKNKVLNSHAIQALFLLVGI